jgi:hypothetical protein
MGSLRRVVVFSIVVASLITISGVATASILFNNPVEVSTYNNPHVMEFSTSGSSPGVNSSLSPSLTSLTANVSFRGFSAVSNYSTSEITLKEGNYSSAVNTPKNFSTPINPISVNASSQASFYGILYQPLNYTNYSHSTAPIFSPRPFTSGGNPHSMPYRVLPTVQEFNLSDGAFVNTLSLLLSGKGIMSVSIGTTILGDQILKNENIQVNGLNYYAVTFPVTFFAGNTQYFLNLYNVSSHALLKKVNNDSANNISFASHDSSALSGISKQGSQFVSITIRGNHGSSLVVFSGTFSIGYNPVAGALPRDIVIFYEYGLNNGGTWSVNVNGTTYTSQSRDIEVDGLNGSFAYTVGSATGMLPLKTQGTVTAGASSYPIIVPAVFYSPSNTAVAGINSSIVIYGSTGVTQQFNVVNGGIMNHISLMLKGTGSVNVSLGYTPYGNQILKNETIRTSGSAGNWYSMSVPETFFSGSENYYISVYSVTGNVEWAFSLFSFPPPPPFYPSFFVGSGFTASFPGTGYIFNLSYSPGISTSGNSSVFFIEYGLPSGTPWGIGILSKTNLVIGSIVSLNSGSWTSGASLYSVSGVKNNMALTFDLSNGSLPVPQFTYENNKTTATGNNVNLTPDGNLTMSISIVPGGSGHGVESFIVYISSAASGSSVKVTYAVTINVSFSFYGKV